MGIAAPSGSGQVTSSPTWGLSLPWWAWALLVLVGALGVLRVDLNHLGPPCPFRRACRGSHHGLTGHSASAGRP